MLSQYLRHRRWQFIVLALLLFVSIGLQLVIPQITRRFIDLAKINAQYRVLIGAALAFIVVSLIQQVITVFARYSGETLAWNATNDLRLDLARHCMRLDMRFHNERTPGEMIERIDGDLLIISQFFSQLVILVLGSVLLLLGILVAFFVENPIMGVVFTAFSVSTLILFIQLRNIAVPHDKANRDALSALFGFIEERLSGTEDIRSSGAVEYVMLGLYKLHYKVFTTWRRSEFAHVTIRLMAGVMMSAGFAIAFVGGYRLYHSGVFTLGTVYLIIHYTELIARPIRILTKEFQKLQNVGANIERVNDLFEIRNNIVETDEANGSREVLQGPVSVRFNGVSFSYLESEPVLSDVSFSVDSGSILGVLGRTGSGKTTIARLIFRLYDVDEGRIFIDDRDLRRFRLDHLRHRVAMVTQDVQLFQATVRQNLTFFDETIEDDRLHEVIDTLGLLSWYERLPHGLDSKLDAAGRGLSAGEAQLLAFTRVFLKDPGLIILDEASSRLDPATEKLIEIAVDRLLVGRSAIIIAHRLTTVHRADDILILEDGRIAEQGRRAVLEADSDSKLSELLRTGLEEVLA